MTWDHVEDAGEAMSRLRLPRTPGVRLSGPTTHFVAGTRDLVISNAFAGPLLDVQAMMVPGLRDTVMIEGAGHWTQQEAPDAVNAALLDFLGSL